MGGFEIVQMDEAQLIYAGAPSVRQNMAVVFRTSQNLENGGRIEVVVPEVYKLSCQASDGFNALSVRGVIACNDAGIGLRLSVNRTISPGSYAFMVGVTNPAYTPNWNLFSLMLKDKNGNVVDARMQFPGERIISGLSVRPPRLKFSSSEPLAEAEVQVTLRINTALDPIEAIGAVRAVQIAVPERFTLVTRMPVRNIDGLPTPETNWYHLYFPDRLVRVDLVSSDSAAPQVIPAGDYRLAFKVRLPEFWMPEVNIWLVSLCRNMRCTDLAATMPIAGFQLGDAAALTEVAAGDDTLGGIGRDHSSALLGARAPIVHGSFLSLG